MYMSDEWGIRDFDQTNKSLFKSEEVTCARTLVVSNDARTKSITARPMHGV